ncbi:AmmeMemoRadiSam system radical SAM enzyme [Fundidesulfovibrio agrisoli]|uniref:AmmeMemoRadiSam system radical SAM enzyme n=1 Tax=Fundidesulfovibrio agrisoli TaxID=2922717 RepID=UPI001FACC81A|nr:AmmeMemoRadiSam system radical SAM enzyme [Fundidesulfovibrio agrisoli]
MNATHPASLWKPMDDGRVHCNLCCHFCIIAPGERGLCGVRTNKDGELLTLVYGLVAALNIDPVEKKPLYHFLPGTTTLSFGTPGCNLRCSFCQNHTLSQPPRHGAAIKGQPAEPGALAETALDSGCRSVSYTYSEPTIFFEFARDTAVEAKKLGLANILVSNGFMSPACLDEFGPLVDAANIDLKAFTPAFYDTVCGGKLEPVKKNLIRMRKLGWWLEVTTLVIPGLNDTPEELGNLARFIAGELGPQTPWHISRFHPDFMMPSTPPTPPSTMEAAWDLGKEAGLEYVYIGNMPAGSHNNTVCHSCGKTLLERRGFSVVAGTLENGRCKACGATVPGRFGSA